MLILFLRFQVLTRNLNKKAEYFVKRRTAFSLHRLCKPV